MSNNPVKMKLFIDVFNIPNYLFIADLSSYTKDPVKSMENTGHIRYKQYI